MKKKQKLSKKLAKKFTTHRKYYSDTVADFRSLNPKTKSQSKEDKLVEISNRQQELKKKRKELQEQKEESDLIQEIGTDNTDELFDGDFYQGHFNERNIKSMVELESVLDQSKQLQSQSIEIDDFGVLTSIACSSSSKQQDKKSEIPKQKNTFHEYNIKKRLYRPWLKTKAKKENELYFTNLQKNLFPIFNEYRDLIYSEENYTNHRSIYKLYTLHAVNHILKAKDQLLQDNAITNDAIKNNQEVPELNHQGFTKPKVLIIVPFKNTCLDIIKFMLKLIPHEPKNQAELKTKLFEQFSDLDQDQQVNENKPDDYKYTFRENIDDCFRIGIQFRKGGLKLYSTFYNSDIIIASPLGLRLVVGTEGDQQRDYDFLSSIEVLIIDQTESILQQNWDHINIIFDNLNQIPKNINDTDFSRVRPAYLEGLAKYYRQNLIFTSALTPEINAIFNRQCFNLSGKIKVKKLSNGEILNVIPNVKQTFQRLPDDPNLDHSELKKQYLIDNILPKFSKLNDASGVLIFIPSYYEYISLRNYFKKEAKSHVLCSEYTKPSAINRARSKFQSGDKTFMLFTERFHFFNRHNIKGIKTIIFFGLPQNTNFYSEMLNFITENSSEASVISIYTNRDRMSLEKIVGTNRYYKMIESEKLAHLFVNK
eukprot:gene477-603_t